MQYSCTAPNIVINILPSGTSTVQHMYSLNCSVFGHEKLVDPTISYQWIKINNTETQVGNNSNTLVFSSLELSDAAEYICRANIDSSYLSNSITVNTTHVVELASKV